MFLNRLDDRQKRTFLAMAYSVALADHWVPDAECAFFDQIKAELQIEHTVPPEQLVGSPDLSPFDTRAVRTIVVLEFLCLAHSDDAFHVDEAHVAGSVVIDVPAVRIFPHVNDLKRLNRWTGAMAGRSGDQAAMAWAARRWSAAARTSPARGSAMMAETEPACQKLSGHASIW